MIKKREYETIVNTYLKHPKVLSMQEQNHHGINRLEHSKRVAYYTYKITKALHLNYQSATKAAILHDFFLDEVKNKSAAKKLRLHPTIAVKNAKKYFGLNELEEDIIRTHMFPITFTPPKYIESWVVDIIDDCASIYERGYTASRRLGIKFQTVIATMVIVFRTFL